VVRLWDIATKEQIARLNGHSGRVGAVVYSPDGGSLVSCGADRTVRVWDTFTGTESYLLEGHTEEAQSVAYSPDGITIAGGGRDGVIALWEASTGLLRDYLPGDTGIITAGRGSSLNCGDATLPPGSRRHRPRSGSSRAS
jgi:WD40 repeat protein